MSSLCCQLLRSHTRRLIRNCQPVRHKAGKGAYEGEGKTTMTILNRDADYALMVDKITTQGFKLNLGVNIFGPVIIFPRSVISWNIGSTADIHEDSMTLFKILEPKPDILILGLDKHYPRETRFIEAFKKVAKELNVKNEVLSVDKACTTFNFLNAEKRYAVAALLPPESVEVDITTYQDTAMRRLMHESWDHSPSEAIEQQELLNPRKEMNLFEAREALKKSPIFAKRRRHSESAKYDEDEEDRKPK